MHITVCICAYRRPKLLERLLHELDGQITKGEFTFSLVVADNDVDCSARPVVEVFAARSATRVVYCTEPRRNIALARNRALEHAQGEFVALIDDDELPAASWLWSLFTAIGRYNVAGVLGPVRPHFDEPPPRWLIDGGFCERAEYPSGTVIHSTKCFAGNALFRRDILIGVPTPFRPQFGLGGEDVDFFRRMTTRGHVFVSCKEAVVKEVIQPCRWTRRYRLQRALLHGSNGLGMCGGKAFAKSMAAVPAYTLMLPVMLLHGQHVFMRYAVKLSVHLGRLLALFGIHPIKQRPL